MGIWVALHVRAWVEMVSVSEFDNIVPPVALHVRAWVEMREVARLADRIKGRPPCEGVGRNVPVSEVELGDVCRPPCEGVGRNAVGAFGPLRL